LAVKASLLVIGEANIDSPKEVALRSEASALFLLLETCLGLHSSALDLSEAKVASLIASIVLHC